MVTSISYPIYSRIKSSKPSHLFVVGVLENKHHSKNSEICDTSDHTLRQVLYAPRWAFFSIKVPCSKWLLNAFSFVMFAGWDGALFIDISVKFETGFHRIGER